MNSAPLPRSRAFALLQKFARPRPPEERCELCSQPLPVVHQHLLEPARRQLLCCCDPCGILFSDQQSVRYRRVPAVLQALTDFRLTDEQWESLRIPINMAFFCNDSAAGRVLALYPSPAGATESLLPLETWQQLVAQNRILQQLEPDIEALLVNRMNGARLYYRVSIDECYKLVGLIRLHWRGLSGGTEVWEEMDRFFESLRERSGSPGEPEHA